MGQFWVGQEGVLLLAFPILIICIIYAGIFVETDFEDKIFHSFYAEMNTFTRKPVVGVADQAIHSPVCSS